MAPKRLLTLRVAEHDLEQITSLAQQQGLSRTEYIVNTALGRLDRQGLEQRVYAVEERMDRLEQLAYTG